MAHRPGYFCVVLPRSGFEVRSDFAKCDARFWGQQQKVGVEGLRELEKSPWSFFGHSRQANPLPQTSAVEGRVPAAGRNAGAGGDRYGFSSLQSEVHDGRFSGQGETTE